MSGMNVSHVEWGVRRTWGDVGSVAEGMDRRTAQRCAREWPGQLVSRVVIAGEWTTHVCDSGNFDRTICPEPCGMMHSFCDTCGERQDACAHEGPQEAVPADLSDFQAREDRR